MERNKRMFWLGIGISLLAISTTFAQEGDIEGSKDHPLISRYPGSIISAYKVAQFDEYILPLGVFKEGKLTKSQKLEGKVTQIMYDAPEDRSALEIYRNYESALKRAGFELLFSATSEELGDEWRDAFAAATSRYAGDAGEFLSSYLGGEGYYLAAKLTRQEGDVYVALYVALGWYWYPLVQLDVIEIKPIETELVTVNAKVLAEDIARTGRATIYGIYFEAGKADVKPESEPVLKEIAKLLQQNPKLNLYVVCHTDNVGTLSANMELSQRRAESVVKVLIAKYGVDATRLKPYGVGPLSPVASNKTEEGRAKNRRVELVEQ